MQSTGSEKGSTKNLFASLGNKAGSPSKFVQEDPPSMEREVQKPVQDKTLGSSKSEAQKKPAASKPPILLKNSSSDVQKKPLPVVNSSSDEDEDEVEIARKWLNMRKEKIKQVNEAIEQGKNDADYDQPPAKKGTQSYRDLLKREAQIPAKQTENVSQKPESNNNIKRTLIPAPKTQIADDDDEDEADIQPQKLQNVAESLPSQSILKSSTPQKKLVINLDDIDEDKIHEIHNLLNSKLSELSGKKKSPGGNEKKFVLSAGKGSKTTQDSNAMSGRAPLMSSNVFKEDLFNQNLAQSGSLYNGTPQNYAQKTQTRMKEEELEIHDLETDRISPEQDSIHPEKQEIKSINNSEIFPEKVADKKLAEIDRLYEEKLKEYLSIRDRMLNSLGTQGEERAKPKVAAASLKDSSNSKINTIESAPIKEYEERTITSGSKDSRITANFSNNPGTAESARFNAFTSSGYPGKPIEATRDEFLHSGVIWPDSKPQESTTRTFQRSGDVRTLARQFARSEVDNDLLQLNDDFYDDQLFDIVNEIETTGPSRTTKKSTKQEPLHMASLQAEEVFAPQSFKKKTKVDEEFAELFNTVNKLFWSYTYLSCIQTH
mgnify:FL=1